MYDAASGALLTDLPVGAMSDQVVAWHPDGERLAVAGSDPRIQIWNVAAKRKLATLEGHVQQVTALTFHPDGDLLASHAWDGVLRLWDPPTGRPLLQLPLTVDDRPRFSADGRWLGAVRHGEQAELLEVTPTREYRTLVSSEGTGGGSYNYGDIQPGRSPAGRGHERRHPPVGPAQRPGARRAARGDHLCLLRRRGGRGARLRSHRTARPGGS